jgi:hypothetical protein
MVDAADRVRGEVDAVDLPERLDHRAAHERVVGEQERPVDVEQDEQRLSRHRRRVVTRAPAAPYGGPPTTKESR